MKGGLLEEWVNYSKAMAAAKTLYTAAGYIILFRGPVASHSKIFPSTTVYPDLS